MRGETRGRCGGRCVGDGTCSIARETQARSIGTARSRTAAWMALHPSRSLATFSAGAAMAAQRKGNDCELLPMPKVPWSCSIAAVLGVIGGAVVGAPAPNGCAVGSSKRT